MQSGRGRTRAVALLLLVQPPLSLFLSSLTTSTTAATQTLWMPMPTRTLPPSRSSAPSKRESSCVAARIPTPMTPSSKHPRRLARPRAHPNPPTQRVLRWLQTSAVCDARIDLAGAVLSSPPPRDRSATSPNQPPSHPQRTSKMTDYEPCVIGLRGIRANQSMLTNTCTSSPNLSDCPRVCDGH